MRWSSWLGDRQIYKVTFPTDFSWSIFWGNKKTTECYWGKNFSNVASHFSRSYVGFWRWTDKKIFLPLLKMIVSSQATFHPQHFRRSPPPPPIFRHWLYSCVQAKFVRTMCTITLDTTQAPIRAWTLTSGLLIPNDKATVMLKAPPPPPLTCLLGTYCFTQFREAFSVKLTLI